MLRDFKVTLTSWVLPQAPFAGRLSDASAGMLRGVWIQPALVTPPHSDTAISTPTVNRTPNTTRDHSVALPWDLASVSDSRGLASFPQGPASPGHSEVQREEERQPRLSHPKVTGSIFQSPHRAAPKPTPDVVLGWFLNKREREIAFSIALLFCISRLFSALQNSGGMQIWPGKCSRSLVLGADGQAPGSQGGVFSHITNRNKRQQPQVLAALPKCPMSGKNQRTSKRNQELL